MSRLSRPVPACPSATEPAAARAGRYAPTSAARRASGGSVRFGRTGLARAAVAVAAAVTLALLPATAPASADPGLASDVRSTYIVALADHASLSTALAQHRLTPTHRFQRALNGFVAELTPAQVAALRADPAVTAVERDHEMKIAFTQLNPPSWGLDRIDQRFLPLDNTYTFNSTAFTVTAYIIDTGIDATHPDFTGRAANVANFAGGPATDCNGHGTYLAGIVGGFDHGVAKQVRLRGVKVLDCAGVGTLAGVISGIDWVAANHVKPAVANISLGGPGSAILNMAVNNLALSGVFVAVAAGSSNVDACSVSPAGAANVTTVMASTITDQRAPFSNFGPCTHLYAPGVGIVSTRPGGGTTVLNGTAAASAHVTGVAAMYKATFGDHAFHVIRGWLMSNATPNVIAGNPPNTPNLLLYTNGL